jgi:hypothetical protein
VILFLVMLLLWAGTITGANGRTLGFVPLTGPEAFGYDIVPALIWFGFLYTIWRLWRVFRGQAQQKDERE